MGPLDLDQRQSRGRIVRRVRREALGRRGGLLGRLHELPEGPGVAHGKVREDLAE
jgi:hypothetical protein